MKVLIVGGGNMGTTFAQGFLAAHIIRPKDLIILENNPERAALLAQNNLGTVKSTAGDYIKIIDLIVLAVKPQDSDSLYKLIQPYITPEKMILSIMAGVKLETIVTNLNTAKVIRAMPNLPAKVGSGMTAFTATEEVTRKELIAVQNLLSTTGRAIYFDEEAMIDASTALSGSGPAYVFFFMNAMIQTAMKLGFSESQAELLVWQTFTGSMSLHNKNDLTCQQWIDRVSSKGGTTEAAIKVFKQYDVAKGIEEGIFAAFNRAEELGKK